MNSNRALLSRSGKAIANFSPHISHFRSFMSFSCKILNFFISFILITMSLLSSSNEQIFALLKNLIQRVNEHVAFQSYAVMLLRIKKFKFEVTRKAWIIYDKDDRLRSARNEKRRHITSRCIKCLFSLTTKRMNDSDDFWLLKMINDQHNHETTLTDFYFTQRKIVMTIEIRHDISRQLQIQTQSFQILSSLRISDLVDSSNWFTKFDYLQFDV